MKMFCNICKMEINEKNYNINSAAFNIENSIENIMYCPFCGVDASFISIEPNFLIPEGIFNETELKIFDHAVKLELFNGDFYKEASKLTKNPKLKKMFEALSVIEYTHSLIHKNLGGFKEKPIINKLDYSKYNNDEIFLDMARKREVHAVEYYNKYKGQIRDQKVISIFEALSSVERSHIELTEI